MTEGLIPTLVALVREARKRKAKPGAKGDLIAFVLSKLRSWIKYELRKRGVPSQDLEDALQEVLIRAVLEKLNKLRKPGAFILFLKYKIQDVAKEFWKGPAFEELLENIIPEVRHARVSPIDMARALAQLPPGYADALVLVYVYGYTYEEAAEALGCSVPSLKKRLEKARSMMRVLLADLV